MSTHALKDDDESFEISVLEPVAPSRVVLFAAGAGGSPERYLSLQRCLCDQGCLVVAPHFPRLVPPSIAISDLLRRAHRLSLALDWGAREGLPAVGVGHSIGATMLLALAGGEAWMSRGERLQIAPNRRLSKLALMAPATGYFQAPKALDAIEVPILAWVGTEDTVTPLSQVELLTQALVPRVPVTVSVCPGAGHFSFMDAPPPGAVEPLPDRERFLAEFADELSRFVLK